MDVLRKLVLKEDGEPAIEDEQVLPVNLTLAVLVRINEYLGKSKAKTTEKKDGIKQN
jgi:hypothetical protein